jgi:hypothetical protein
VDVGSQPVFSLKAMQAESFFVGERGMLVHDNSLIHPVLRPFAAMPKLAAGNRPNAAASTGR